MKLKEYAGPDPEDESESAPESRRSTWDKPGSDELGKSSLRVSFRVLFQVKATSLGQHARSPAPADGWKLTQSLPASPVRSGGRTRSPLK